MSTSFEVTGTIISIMDTQQVTDTFKKREFVIEIPDGNYPQKVKFQIAQDKTSLLDNFKAGQEVNVHFNLRGREYTRKSDGSTDYWLNLDCWRLNAADGGSASKSEYDQISPAQSSGVKEDADDVPF